MFIRYHGTNVHALPFVTFHEKRLKNKKTGKVRVTQEVDNHQSPRDVFALKPGWNQFPNHVWDQNKNTPSVVRMLQSGRPNDRGKPTKRPLIELMDETVKVKKRDERGKLKIVSVRVGTDDKPVKLKYFGAERAVAIVTGTFDRQMLQGWLDEENRGPVKRVIQKQLKPLLAKKQNDDEDEGFSSVDEDDGWESVG